MKAKVLLKSSEKRAAQKPRGKPFTGADDPRRAKGGRPKNEHNVTYWLKQFGQLTPVELAERCKIYEKTLRSGGDDQSIFALVAIRALLDLMNDMDARLFTAVLDRTEGKVAQPITATIDKELKDALAALPADQRAKLLPEFNNIFALQVEVLSDNQTDQ